MSLLEAKNDLRDALLATGVKVHTFVPAAIRPPMIVMGESDPYITEVEDRSFGEVQMQVNLFLIIIAEKSDNEGASKQMDALIEKAISETTQAGWTVSVGAPYLGGANGNVYLSCNIAVSNTFELN